MNQKEYDRRKQELAKPAYDALMKCYPFTLDDLDGEIWKPIAGYEELYHESNYGRTKSFWKGKAKILNPSMRRDYLCVTLSKDNKPKHFQVHRLVAQAFVPNPEGKPQVNHIDGCKFNNFVGNLEWATQSENQQHAVDTGLRKQPQGEKHGMAKLTNEQVEYIRLNSKSLTGVQLAEMFGVSASTISQIQTGKIYRNATGSVRKSKCSPVSDEIRDQIRADWATGNYTKAALARKYGYDHKTIRRIINS